MELKRGRFCLLTMGRDVTPHQPPSTEKGRVVYILYIASAQQRISLPLSEPGTIWNRYLHYCAPAWKGFPWHRRIFINEHKQRMTFLLQYGLSTIPSTGIMGGLYPLSEESFYHHHTKPGRLSLLRWYLRRRLHDTNPPVIL